LVFLLVVANPLALLLASLAVSGSPIKR
jgi:hypothetical protein